MAHLSKATAILAAAGSGSRLGAGGPKALTELAGRPLAAWSLAALAATEAIEGIVVAAPPGAEAELREIAAAAIAEALPVTIVSGGASRSESVARALAEVDSELVAVHDAARPLLPPGLLDALVARLADRPDAAAVIAATPLTDTVKRAREPRAAHGEVPRGGPTVARTESREHLWAAQTPQLFRTAVLRAALATDSQRVAAATDDAWLVEQAGGKVLIEPSPASNLKVTTPEELRLAELMLRERS